MEKLKSLDIITIQENKFIELFNNCSVNIKSNEFPDFIIFNENGAWMLDYYKSINKIDVSYKRIFVFFENEFDMNYDETFIFLQKMISKYFKLKNVKINFHNL